ncbi:MAG: ribonuclease HI [Spirochaetota bacterium]
MKEVTIYTDGACSGNPGKGGWGAILIYNGKEKEISGNEENTTNNRMEMTAVIKALKALKEPCKVYLHTDSNYIVNAFNKGWVYNWRDKAWMNGTSPRKNKDLWIELLELSKIHKIKWIKVKGHSDDIINNRADKLAVNSIKK